MARVHRILAATLALLLIASSGLASAQHVVDPSVLMGAVAEHAAKPDVDRNAIRKALQRSDVQEMARMMGADVRRLSASIDTLSGGDLERAAAAARRVNQQEFTGGATVVISTTTIIVVLLVVILLVVALK
jgi:hypothetical protein